MKKLLPKGFILSVLEHFNVPYFIFGNTVKVKCPFHDDKNPSASVNLDKNTFICFVCRERLYEKLNIKSKNTAISSRNLFKLLGGNKKEWKTLVKYSYENPEKYKEIISKIKKIKATSGYISKVWDELDKNIDENIQLYLKNRKIKVENIIKEIRSINGKFKKWPLAVALYDMQKNIIGIQLKSIDEKTSPKVIMYPGSNLGFLGLDKVKKGNLTVFVEGLPDYLTAKSLGFKNVIGITSASQSIPEEITKYVSKHAIFFVHNDEAGINLYKKLKKICMNKDINLFPIKPSKKHGGDLNDFVIDNKNSKVLLKNYLLKLLKGVNHDYGKK